MATILGCISRARALRKQSREIREERRRRRLEREQSQRGRESTEELTSELPAATPRPGLIDYVAKLWPDLDRFDHFAPYAVDLENAIGGALRVWFAAPPQHGKSQLTLRAFLWWARFFPGYRHAYVTYSREKSREMAEEFRALAIEAGFSPKGTLSLVRLEGGTEIRFTSIQGGLTGSPITGVCVIDDPVKDAEEARSPKIRRRFEQWWVSVARARRHKGTSFIGMGTRWHLDDPGGYLTAKQKFRYVNLKAIATPKNAGDLDDQGRVVSDPLKRKPGESLWHAQKPPEFFEEERTNIYWWSAMYQGEPVPMGASVFAEPGTVGTDESGKEVSRGARFYKELPNIYRAGAFGLDLAYTAKTAADWSICIEGIASGNDLYIIDVQRKQVEATSFALTLKTKADKRPGWKMRWYASGTEKGAAQFIRKQLRKGGADPFRVMTAVGDKFVRSMGAAGRWNAGHILLPDPEEFNVPWLADFLDVVTRFTGVDDAHDDDIDALAALHDQLFHASRMTEALTG
jgi:predicted phage terminase large subunit-like protein